MVNGMLAQSPSRPGQKKYTKGQAQKGGQNANSPKNTKQTQPLVNQSAEPSYRTVGESLHTGQEVRYGFCYICSCRSSYLAIYVYLVYIFFLKIIRTRRKCPSLADARCLHTATLYRKDQRNLIILFNTALYISNFTVVNVFPKSVVFQKKTCHLSILENHKAVFGLNKLINRHLCHQRNFKRSSLNITIHKYEIRNVFPFNSK